MPKSAKTSNRAQDYRALPGHLIRRVHQASVALFSEECAALDLTPVQYAALFIIGESPGIDATRVSEQIFFDRSTTGAVLDRLEKKRWLVRAPSKSDRRVKILTLTPEGTQVLRRASPAIVRVQQSLLAPLTEKQRKTFQQLLAALAEAHKDRESGTNSPEDAC